MSDERKLKISDFIHDDKFELNSYLIQLFNYFNHKHTYQASHQPYKYCKILVTKLTQECSQLCWCDQHFI